MTLAEPTPESFLRLIRRRGRGRLKVLLGYAPGVGKTYQMLLEGQRLRDRGVDVVIGYLEGHGRADTESLALGLEAVPRRVATYRGIRLEEMDVDAVIARKPEVALIDELAHTNAPGSRNEKRYQDVMDILEAGISVLTTVNVQHFESLYDTVERLVGVKVKERLPDWVVAEADQVVNVDVSTEDLEQRLQEGKIYPRERVLASLANFFRRENLAQLRGLAFSEAAAQVARGLRQTRAAGGAFVPDQVMVGISSGSPSAAALLRFGSRLAGRLDRNWYAVYVRTPREQPERADASTQRRVADLLSLAHELGATVFTFNGDDVASTLLAFAREYGVGHIVVGRPRPRPWRARLLGRNSPVEDLIRRAAGYSVVVVDPEASAVPVERPATAPTPVDTARPRAYGMRDPDESVAPAPPSGAALGKAPSSPALAELIDARAVLFLAEAVPFDEILARLVAALVRIDPTLDGETALRRLRAREREGSTLLDEGLALPHARLLGLGSPRLALAIAPAGEAGRAAVTVLLLAPEEEPAVCLALMSRIARLFRGPELRRALAGAGDADQAAAAWAREAARLETAAKEGKK